MGDVIKTVSSTGSDYWAAYIGGEKLKTDGPDGVKDTWTDVITH